MTKHNGIMGRPSMKIDKALVRNSRRERRWSQLELAKCVYNAAGETKTSLETMKTTAYRWEKNGTVTPHLEEHLAKALGVTLPELRGERPVPAPNRVEYLAEQLQRRASQGECTELKAILKEYERYGEDPIKALAGDLNRDMEWAHVTQDPEEHRRIEHITGLTANDIRKPASHNGTWLLITSGPLLPQRCEIIQSMRAVVHEVKTELEKLRGTHNESDVQVAFKKTNHWFTVTYLHPRHKQLTSVLRFARFQAMEKGLMWSQAAKEDEDEFRSLMQSAYSLFNFVSDTEGTLTPERVTHLRLLLEEELPDHRTHLSATIRQRKIKLFAGELKKLHGQTLTNFHKDGNAHFIAMDRLTKNLWSYVQPRLSTWPLNCWSLRAAEGRIDILLDNIPIKLLLSNGPRPKLRGYFTLNLVELMQDDSHRPVPWAQESVESVLKKLQDAHAAAKKQAVQPNQ